ncbi:hypothetical protein TNCV_2757961 [Trichonephila clavipes]|nr:hypothetical protein TNCV_2757961 [Trichonephila clavipes]
MAIKIKNKLIWKARRVVSSLTPVSGKSYVSATSKTYKSTAIQCDASTAPIFEKTEYEKPKTIAVDTCKTVSTPSNVNPSGGSPSLGEYGFHAPEVP